MVHILIVLWVGLFFITGCDTPSTRNNIYDELKSQLREGDLLFRRGTGVVGHIVTAMDSEGCFSHVGIVVRCDDEWCVIHAVPHEPDFEGDFDRVKCEAVECFLGRYPNGDYGLYRTTIAPDKVAIAVRNARRLSDKQVRFDHNYDLADTTELYCTELIEYVYGLAGVTLSEGRRTEITFPIMEGSHIMPSDLTKSSLLKPL